MTRDETKQIIRIMMDAYANYKPLDIPETVDTWHALFADDDFTMIKTGLYAYMRTDRTGFAPSPGQIIAKATDITADEMREAEAWERIYKAICNSSYHSQEEYDSLPDNLKRCVTPRQLREWALNEDLNTEVVRAQVMRCYRQENERKKDRIMMGEKLTSLIEKTIGMLEAKENT